MHDVLLGLDIGSSSVKAALVDASTGMSLAAAQSPAEEMPMLAAQAGWAEQDPDLWWQHVVISIKTCLAKSRLSPERIQAIGISYQMHGLVVVGQDLKPLRPSIIWCDSRAVAIGEKAMNALGRDYCLRHLLNSPGNFTASKLRWVKEYEPETFSRIFRIMLPGDYIALRLTGELSTTITGMSEAVLWDYQSKSISDGVMRHFGFDRGLIPEINPVFSVQGRVTKAAASELGLHPGTAVAYRAGDQPNNALSLNVLEPGETAATAGTSGVIYGVTDKNAFDARSRVNTFVHVNNSPQRTANGVLLCVNGTGILNSWLRKNTTTNDTAYGYDTMNTIAARAPVGSDGLLMLPFGNGAERILENKLINASIVGLDFNRHGQAHLFRAAQEGIVFALRYGFDILQDMGLSTRVIRAGNANMFLSSLFREAFVNTIGARLELFDTDGARGAALGAGVGSGLFPDLKTAFKGLKLIGSEEPAGNKIDLYQQAYESWKSHLTNIL